MRSSRRDTWGRRLKAERRNEVTAFRLVAVGERQPDE